MRAMEYIMATNLELEQKEDLMKLVESMNSLGLSDEVKLKSVTIGEINNIHRGGISEHGVAMLKKKFQIRGEIASSFNSGMVACCIEYCVRYLELSKIIQIFSTPCFTANLEGCRLSACRHII